jgi:D-glycero-D-manno-heptose 1,7-bisphosphate phosphatase
MKLIVLDRDGVINQDSDAYIKHPDEWHPEAGALEAIVALKQAGWTVAIATNQSGLNRGYYTREILSQMHQKLQHKLVELGDETTKVDWINFSPYLSTDGSQCRKPGNGLLKMIEQRFHTSLENCPMVGDTFNDIMSAKSMKMTPYLVRTGKGQGLLKGLDNASPSEKSVLDGVIVCDNLLKAVEAILK